MRKDFIEYTPDDVDFYDMRQLLLLEEKGIEPLRPANVRYLIIHCTATRCTADYRPQDLIRDHEARSWHAVGYHFYIRKNGVILQFRRTDELGAHCRNHNWQSLGIAYEGGLDEEGDPADTLTTYQIESMRVLIASLARDFPNVVVRGHRDFNPNKACPCFDARDYFRKCTNEPAFV